MIKTYLFVLVALAHGEGVGVTGMQTITYHSTIAECQEAMNKLLPQINKDYVKLECVPLEMKQTFFEGLVNETLSCE